MKRSLRILLMAHLVCTSVGLAADWPQWRGPNRDGTSAETGLRKMWPAEGLKPVWVAEGLGKGYSQVTVVGAAIYATGMVGTNHQGMLSVFDLEGRLKRQSPYGQEWPKAYPGARSTPTVDGDRVYVLTGLGRLVCLDAGTGATRWSEDVAATFGGTSPMMGFAEGPLVHKDRVFCTPGGKEGSVVAFDKTSGRLLWTSKALIEQSAYCSPILVQRGGTSLIVTMTARSVVGIDPDTGRLVWSQPQDPKANDTNHAITPVYQDGYLYVTSGHGKGGQMLELSPDGCQVTQKWVDGVLNPNHSGVVFVGGYVYGVNGKGEWVCLEARSGQVMYATKGVATGAMVYADGMFYSYAQNGTLALVKASPKGCELVSQTKVTLGKDEHWAHPVISGGRLYIRHGDVLMAYDIRAE